MSITRRIRTLECEFTCTDGTGSVVTVRNGSGGDIVIFDQGQCSDYLRYSKSDAQTLACCLNEVLTGDPKKVPALPEGQEKRPQVVVSFDYYKDGRWKQRKGEIVGTDDRHVFVVEEGTYKSFLRENMLHLSIRSVG